MNLRQTVRTLSAVALLATWVGSIMPLPACAAQADPSAMLRKKKDKKKNKKDEAKADTLSSTYKQITGRDSVEMKGAMNVINKKDSWYLEIPVSAMGRDILVVNRLQRVPKELNEAGVNRGINYESQVVSFEYRAKDKKVMIRRHHLNPEVDSTACLAVSVQDNYINPLIASLKVEAIAKDSSTVVVKVDELFNGKRTSLNDVFGNINLGTSPNTDLSRIVDIRSFENNVTATSELTTFVSEGGIKVPITVVTSSVLYLLPETPMAGRLESARIGYFTTNRLFYADKQQQVKTRKYITRWRVEPANPEAYLRGELSEPVKPIAFYLDPALPAHLRPYIKQGILDWNTAFEKAGFKNAVRVIEGQDSVLATGDDMNQSVFTYAASTKANAFGPSTIDPRTGEILEADVVWWHNVVSLLREWLMVQTGTIDPAVTSLQLPDSLMGEAARFVACHEVGHSLGLRHNMIASWTYPTDSLRSPSFTERMGGTSASIMDYARFNYVAQPGDGVKVTSPHIGPYDFFAVEYGYRWYPDAQAEKEGLKDVLNRHRGRLYKYSEAQPSRSAVDPRALSEDLGDDAMKSAGYSIANLKRIVPEIVNRTRTGETEQTYDEAARLYSGIIFQWNMYSYHVMANVGGIYLENTSVGDGQKTYTYVEKEKQRRALQFLIDEYITYPEWLFRIPLTDYTFLHHNTPLGMWEQSPNLVYKNSLNYILWDLLDNDRLIRMCENELKNGAEQAFTLVEMMDMLHKHIFAPTIAGRKTDLMTRNLQKAFVDALITAAAESEGVKINKRLYDKHPFLCDENRHICSEGAQEAAAERMGTIRTLEMSSTQINRISDVLSVKRAELLRVLQLVTNRKNGADVASRYHYEDLALRIRTALGLAK